MADEIYNEVTNRLHSVRESESPKTNHIVSGADEVYDDVAPYRTNGHIDCTTITPVGTENPIGLRWYERVNNGTEQLPQYEWIRSQDTTADAQKTYGIPNGAKQSDINDQLYGMVGDADKVVLYASEYEQVTPQQGDNPQANGWYELSGSTYVLTTDTTVVSGKNYYVRIAHISPDESKITNQEDGYIPTAGAVGRALGANFEDNLTSTSTVKGLTANQGRVLNERKADINGYYESMGSGTADNLAGTVSTSVEYVWHKSNESLEFGEGAASITKIKGKTLVWNQQFLKTDIRSTATNNEVTFTNNQDGTISTSGTATGGDAAWYFIVGKRCITGHKYLFKCAPKGGSSSTYYVREENALGFSDYGSGNVFTVGNSTTFTFRIIFKEGCNADGLIFRPQLIDLTLMFGAGNEPSTVAEFEALYPLDYYAYNAGTLINNTASGIVTTGFNQWDEDVIATGYINNDGNIVTGYGTRIASRNYIHVIPNTTYYFKIPYSISYGIRVAWYNENKELIYVGDFYTISITVPSNASYMRFNTASQYNSLTYNNNICINLSSSRNGEYEPYKSPQTLYFNGPDGSLATITGRKIVDGEPTGDSVTIFPEGMKSAGRVYDFGKADSDGYIRKVTKVLKKLVLNADNIDQIYVFEQYNGNYYVSYRADYTPDAKPNSSNIVSTNGKGSIYALPDSMYIVGGSTNLVWFPLDQTITTKEAYKTYISNNPVTLYYELNTPEEYLLDTPIPATYYVHPGGTEERIPEDTASVVAAPISYEVQYPIDAVKTIQNLDNHYVNATVEQSFDSAAKAQARNNIGAQAQLVVSAPASASSTGTEGTIAFDSNYIYVCTSTNTWKRAALETWS